MSMDKLLRLPVALALLATSAGTASAALNGSFQAELAGFQVPVRPSEAQQATLAEEYVTQHRAVYGLSQSDDPELESVHCGLSACTIVFKPQTVGDATVEGTAILVRTDNGQVVEDPSQPQGRWLSGLTPSRPTLSAAQAKIVVVSGVPCENGRTCTFDPSLMGDVELVIPNFTAPAGHPLCWRVNALSRAPAGSYRIYVDASTGAVFHVVNVAQFGK
jgi:hypothetical protein